MTFVEISKKIDKSKENECYVDLDVLCLEFGIFDYGDYNEPELLKAYWIGNWYCTDTWVGYKMYFYNGNPVCISTQLSRKSDEKFQWFDTNSVDIVKNYILNLLIKEVGCFINFTSINEHFTDTYKINYNAQLMKHHKPLLNGRPVKILNEIIDKPNYGVGTKLNVELEDGTIEIVDIYNLDFKFNLIDYNNK